jgi:hypothetical protein
VKSRGFSLIEQSYIIGKMVEKKIRKCALLIAKNCALLFAKTCALLIAKKCALLFTDYTHLANRSFNLSKSGVKPDLRVKP